MLVAPQGDRGPHVADNDLVAAVLKQGDVVRIGQELGENMREPGAAHGLNDESDYVFDLCTISASSRRRVSPGEPVWRASRS